MPSELQEAVGILLEKAGIDQRTCDAIGLLIERGELMLRPDYIGYSMFDGSPVPPERTGRNHAENK